VSGRGAATRRQTDCTSHVEEPETTDTRDDEEDRHTAVVDDR
jgi:hypothetical protein